MLNLIKNELIKLFNKKTIYVMIILVILLSILTMYISKKQNQSKNNYNKISLIQIENVKNSSKTKEDKSYLTSLVRDYVIGDIFKDKTIKNELKNYYKNELLKSKFNYYSMKITEEYLSKNIELNKTYFYNELKNYILNINKEEIKTLIKKDKEEYKNNQLKEAVNLLTFYENNNVDFSNERLVEKYNLLYSYNQDISQIKLRVKEIEKNIDNVGKENKNTQTYKNLSEQLKEENLNLKRINLNAQVIEKEIKNKVFSSDDNLLVSNANNAKTLTLFFLLIGMIAIGASIVSEEYSKSTIKLLLIRPYSRSKILLAKYITTLISMLILLIIMFVVSLILNVIYNGGNIFDTLIYGNLLTNKVVTTSVLMYYIKLMISFIPMILMYTTLAFSISVLTMSSSIANMLSFGIFFISQILEGLAIVFNFSLIKYSFTVVSDYTSYVSMISYGNSMFNVANKFNLTLLEQNITYILYMILFLILAFVVFKKRDIKNI